MPLWLSPPLPQPALRAARRGSSSGVPERAQGAPQRVQHQTNDHHVHQVVRLRLSPTVRVPKPYTPKGSPCRRRRQWSTYGVGPPGMSAPYLVSASSSRNNGRCLQCSPRNKQLTRGVGSDRRSLALHFGGLFEQYLKALEQAEKVRLHFQRPSTGDASSVNAVSVNECVRAARLALPAPDLYQEQAAEVLTDSLLTSPSCLPLPIVPERRGHTAVPRHQAGAQSHPSGHRPAHHRAHRAPRPGALPGARALQARAVEAHEGHRQERRAQGEPRAGGARACAHARLAAGAHGVARCVCRGHVPPPL